MIGAVLLWLRRGTPGRAFPGLLGMELATLFTRTGWWHEWDWAFSQASVGLSLVGPVVAGMVAHDRARRAEPTVALLAAASLRGRRALLAVALAGAVSAAGAWLVGIGVAAVLAARDASGLPDPWEFLEALALIAVCVSAGLAAGTLSRSLLVGPLTAIALFLGGTLLASSALSLTGFLRVTGSTGSLIAIQRTPASSLALIVAHACLAMLCLALALCVPPWRSGRGLRRLAALSAASLATVSALVALDRVSAEVDPYEWVGGPDRCVQGTVTVCGPVKGWYVTRAAQSSLAAAVARLGASGVPWQRTYLIAHAHEVPPELGVLDVSPEDTRDDALPPAVVASSLARPRLCRSLFAADTAEPTLEDQDVVATWVGRALASQRTPGRAPAEVQAAYQRLRTCEPETYLP